jgi:colanic acid/amylovoran biosynthesis protein
MGTPTSAGNRGVLALGSSLVNLCLSSCDDSDVVLLLGNRDSNPVRFRVAGKERMIPIVNCRLSLRSRPSEHLAWIVVMSVFYRLLPIPMLRRAIARSTPWIRAIEKAAIIGDVRGGDSFSDIYGMKRFMHGFFTAWSVILVNGSIVQFPQTYGPYKSGVAKRLARYLLRQSSVIIARDERSRRVALDLLGAGREVLLCPDVAFSLEVVIPDEIVLDPPVVDNDFKERKHQRSIIGLNVNGLMFNGGYTRDNMFGLRMDYIGYLRDMVIELLKEHDGEIWLIPHTFAVEGSVESDPEASHKLRNSLPPELQGRVRIVARDYDQHEIKGVIGLCDFFIGSRMHACIAALSQGIPCLGVAYSMKFAGVFESVGMEEWVIDAREVSSDEAVERTIELYRRRDAVREPLSEASEQARARLTEVFRELVSSTQESGH